MQAVILAGGLGKRLRSSVAGVPKSMAPIGNKPFLEYQISELKKNGIERFLILVGYRGNLIKEYFGDGSRLGVEIGYSEESQPLGTAGALMNAWDELDEEFFLFNGDTFFYAQFDLMVDFVRDCRMSALIALKFTENAKRYGRVDIDTAYRVVEFAEKGELPSYRIDSYINAGAYCFQKSVLEPFYKSFSMTPFSLEREVLPELSGQGVLYGLPLGGAFVDIGMPADYELAQKQIPLLAESERRPALFLDRDGVIVKDKGYVHGKDLDFVEESFEMITEANNQGKLVIVVTNQAGVAKGYYRVEDVISTNDYINSVLRERGMSIDLFLFCPYHPEGTVEEFKRISLCRKPYPGMIMRACDAFPIDLRESVMVGDKETDRIKLPYLRFIRFGDRHQN